MPGGDRTGPAGMGPMTGRAGGYCAGYGVPGYTNPVLGRGFGRGAGRSGGFGRGGRMGWRNRFYATGLTSWQRGAYGYPVYGGGMPYNMPYPPASDSPYAAGLSKEDELSALKGQTQYLENTIESVNKRVAELEEEIKAK
ncbi:MAG: DUF5320 domain-containing protein [Thermodesulfobacteriota bacterium]|nr:DUF5320 domain-containing protein [Thermodesulfobacteriota bacterium]